MTTLKTVLNKHLLPSRVDPVEGELPEDVKAIREALRVLGVLKDVRGTGRSLVIVIDVEQARLLSSLLTELSNDALNSQKAIIEHIRKQQL